MQYIPIIRKVYTCEVSGIYLSLSGYISITKRVYTRYGSRIYPFGIRILFEYFPNIIGFVDTLGKGFGLFSFDEGSESF